MDNITLQLNSPITEDQWDAITDVDFENTKEILFTTKHKKNVRFVKAQQWIPCSESLPEEGQEVLFSTKTGTVQIGKYSDRGCLNSWFSYCDKCRAWNNVVNAWMPLPAPYKGENDG